MNAGNTRNSDNLERALRSSLQPVDPGPGFTAALERRLANPDWRAAPVAAAVMPSARQRRWHAATVALAASTLLVLAVGWQLSNLRLERQAAQANREQRVHAQLLRALAVTADRLGRAQQSIELYQSKEKSL